jgi:hypothetical protein
MSNPAPLERVNFFAGKLLTADDLAQEQTYHLDRHRRHNRFCHGWGVVAGLSVSITDDSTLTVEPGIAIDCAGNELAVVECMRVPLGGLSGKSFLCIRYTERLVQPVPSPTEASLFARIRECVIAELLPIDPSLDHEHNGPGTPGCGLAHPLCVATISRQRGRWRIGSCTYVRGSGGVRLKK